MILYFQVYNKRSLAGHFTHTLKSSITTFKINPHSSIPMFSIHSTSHLQQLRYLSSLPHYPLTPSHLPLTSLPTMALALLICTIQAAPYMVLLLLVSPRSTYDTADRPHQSNFPFTPRPRNPEITHTWLLTIFPNKSQLSQPNNIFPH